MVRSSTTFRPKWKLGNTTVIRVPKTLARTVLNYAHELDQKSEILLHDPAVAYRTAEDVEINKPVPQRSPFRYPGGKTWLVPYIRSWLTYRAARVGVLVEPFPGGGIIALTAGFEGLAEHAVLVERDANVGAVWHTIFGGQAKWLENRILNFEFTRENVTAILRKEPVTQRERTFTVILRNRVQRGGIMAEGGWTGEGRRERTRTQFPLVSRDSGTTDSGNRKRS